MSADTVFKCAVISLNRANILRYADIVKYENRDLKRGVRRVEK